MDYQKAEEDAQRLYQAGEGKLGTDESCFNMVLASRSFPQLKATVEAYSRVGVLLLIQISLISIFKNNEGSGCYCISLSTRSSPLFVDC